MWIKVIISLSFQAFIPMIQEYNLLGFFVEESVK